MSELDSPNEIAHRVVQEAAEWSRDASAGRHAGERLGFYVTNLKGRVAFALQAERAARLIAEAKVDECNAAEAKVARVRDALGKMMEDAVHYRDRHRAEVRNGVESSEGTWYRARYLTAEDCAATLRAAMASEGRAAN